MTRCLTFLTSPTLWLALLGATTTLSLSPAWAQNYQRQFPAAALRGTLKVTAPPQVTINGKPERLAPGARIRNTNNLLLLSASLVGQALTVNYLRDPQGQIREVWLLSATEAQEKRTGMDSSNIVFDADTTPSGSANGQMPLAPMSR